MGEKEFEDFLEQTNRYKQRVIISTTKTLSRTSSLMNYTGLLGEEIAKKHLQEKGFTLCAYPTISSSKVYSYIKVPRDESIPEERRNYSSVPNIFATELGICPHIKCKKPSKEAKLLCKNIRRNTFCEYSKNEDRTEDAETCPCTFIYPEICFNCIERELCPIYEILKIQNIKNSKNKRQFYGADFIAHKDGKNYIVEVKTNRRHKRFIQQETLARMNRLGFESILIDVTIPLNLIKIARAQ